jgi:epoxyqueuosine reductase
MSGITNHSKRFTKHFNNAHSKNIDFSRIAQDIKTWASELGFQQTGITNTRLNEAESHLLNWLKAGHHGEMAYMAQHGSKRSRPDELLPGTITILSVRMDYFPESDVDSHQLLKTENKAYIARYALGRDYHKVLRQRLQKLATKIEHAIGPFAYRVFTDSAPVMEKAIGEKAGIGWIGKHSNLIHEKQGSWFFLGEIYTDLPLPIDTPANNHCGRCTSCIDICPTNAIIAPYQVDARRCISYLTIELRGSIPEELRPFLGNRIYGCDDCQLICPWNRFASTTKEKDFLPRHNLDSADLIDLFAWSESEFLSRMEGSPIRRIGYECWLRNIAVALGNAPASDAILEALNRRLEQATEMPKEHIQWAINQQHKKI